MNPPQYVPLYVPLWLQLSQYVLILKDISKILRSGDPCWTRTSCLKFRKLALYPDELTSHATLISIGLCNDKGFSPPTSAQNAHENGEKTDKKGKRRLAHHFPFSPTPKVESFPCAGFNLTFANC